MFLLIFKECSLVLDLPSNDLLILFARFLLPCNDLLILALRSGDDSALFPCNDLLRFSIVSLDWILPLRALPICYLVSSE